MTTTPILVPVAAVADRPGLRTRQLLGANLIGGAFHPSCSSGSV